MKQKLKEKYPLHDYQDDPYDQLTGIRQGGLMMIEHVNKFEQLKIGCKGVEDIQLTLSQFRSRLRLKFAARC